MKASDKVKKAIKEFEGCRLKAYQCTGGAWTVGFGHTGKDVLPNMNITSEMAEVFFNSDIQKAQNSVIRYDSIYKWTQNEFDAMVSFAFNIGSIDGLTQHGTRSKEQIAAKITEYNKAAGRVVSGLVQRRCYEKKLFLADELNVENKKVCKTLKLGDRGIAVMSMQERLIQIGAMRPDAVDSIYGAGTESVIKALQYNTGIKVDGICGIITQKVIDEIYQTGICYSDYINLGV